MIKFLFLLLILNFGALQSQNLYTNAPDLVYPALEEFISENHFRGTSVLEKLQQLDSVLVRDLGYKVDEYAITKYLGFNHYRGNNQWIEIDSSLIEDPAKFKTTFQHELGHFFGLKHIDVDGLPLNDPRCFEIMSNRKSPYYDQVLQEVANDNYYKEMHKILMPKT